MKQSSLYLTLLNLVMCSVNVKSLTLYKECFSEDGKNDYQIDLFAVPVPPDWNASIVYGLADDDGYITSFNDVESLKFNGWGDAPEVYISECPSGYTTKFGYDTDEENAYCFKKINDEKRNKELTVAYRKINDDDECNVNVEELMPKENTDTETEINDEVSEDEDSEDENKLEADKESEDESNDKKLPLKSSSTKDPWKCGKEYGKCKEGYCCSKYGWCGKSSAYCDNGCQSEFGVCNESTNKHPWQCGKEYGKCKEGYCCSKYGWCGKTDKYCSKERGCQSEFGVCW